MNESHDLGQPQLSAALHLGAANLLLPFAVNTDLGPLSRPAHHLWPPAPTSLVHSFSLRAKLALPRGFVFLKRPLVYPP